MISSNDGMKRQNSEILRTDSFEMNVDFVPLEGGRRFSHSPKKMKQKQNKKSQGNNSIRLPSDLDFPKENNQGNRNNGSRGGRGNRFGGGSRRHLNCK